MCPSTSPQPPDAKQLDPEVNRLYNAVFGTDAPAVVASRFQAAAPLLDRKYSDEAIAEYRAALAYDIEAIEIAARYTRRLPLLSEKIHLVVYLAETLPENHHLFVNVRDNFLAATWAIVLGGFRSAYKLAKGLIIIRRVLRA